VKKEKKGGNKIQSGHGEKGREEKLATKGFDTDYDGKSVQKKFRKKGGHKAYSWGRTRKVHVYSWEYVPS